MKKLIVIVALMLGVAVAASAQPRALGLRAGWGGELSYQHSLGGENFLEADLGWWANGISVAAAYDISIAPLGPFNFYAGPAAQVFTYTYNDVDRDYMRMNLGVGAQIGIEYIFDQIPFQISVDWRPMVTLLNGVGFGWNSAALGLRYAF
jgi:hypothetical protein